MITLKDGKAAPSFFMGCILDLTSLVLEAGGFECRSISAFSTNFRSSPADLDWLCLRGYGESLWAAYNAWGNEVSGVLERG